MSVRAIHFDCHGERLHGVLEMPASPRDTVVLIPVGGPQYRIGSHRQFVQLARALADAGFASLRFDYRGMGDSEGDSRDFEAVSDDLRAAVAALRSAVPGSREVVVWGLCDAASAALLHLSEEPSVSGMVLVNPWARTPQGESRTLIKQYYGTRLLNWAAWRELLRSPGRIVAALRSALTHLRGSLSAPARAPLAPGAVPAAAPLPERMLRGMERFRGDALFVLSGDDLTAAEFSAAVAGSRAWQRRLAKSNVQRRELPGANHTFSTRAWRDQVIQWTTQWLQSRATRGS